MVMCLQSKCTSVTYLCTYCINPFSTDIRADLGQRHQRSMFDQKATRRHFITRQDCRNACRKVRDFTNHLHHNDAVSVDRIVKELQLEDPSPVIAYKPRGITNEKYPLLTEENFLLVLMTEFQATLFQKFSTLVCVDSTHKTNEYGYKLISIVVADEFRNGKNIIIYVYIVAILNL